MLSTEGFYRWIYNQWKKGQDYTMIVNNQERIGDLETDLIKCTNGYLLTIMERKTLFNIIKEIPDKQALTVQSAIVKALQPYQYFIKTITADNGTELACHLATSQSTKCNLNFADPYKSQQRGINENQNGFIRQYFKNKTDLNNIADQYLKKI